MAAVAHPVLQSTLWAGEGGTYHPETGNDRAITVHPAGPSGQHWLGTDSLGRDVVSALTYSLAEALALAVVVALVVGVLSLTVGSVAAYFRGWTDMLFTNIGDALALLPPAIALLVVGLNQTGLGPVEAGVLFGVLYGLGPAALIVRSRALAVIEKPFIDAAKVAGAGPRRILGTHLLPHLLPYAGVQMMAAVIGALVTQAFIQYQGASANRVGLGSMIYSGLDFQPVLPTGYGSFNLGDYTARIGWFSLMSAAMAMTLISVAFYLIAVGSRDAIVPKRHQ
jgi:peptide/nickel transport system permease protein